MSGVKRAAARAGWGVLAIGAATGVYALASILGQNLHEVIPGAVYRSAQPDPDELVTLAEELGLASVLAVRAARPNKDWYVAERRVTQQLGLAHSTVNLHPDRMPSRQRLVELVQRLDSAPRPLLLHCRAGVERSGLASAVAVLLAGGSLEAARAQFGLRFGFHPWLAQSDLPRVIDRYEAWLAELAEGHDPDLFRRFAGEAYVPAFYAAALELVEIPSRPLVGREIPIGLRVANRSPEAMRFRISRDSGVHIGVLLESLDDTPPFRHEGRSGRVDFILEPGAARVFEFSLAPVPSAGRYRLTIDLVDESVVWFAAMGSDPLVAEFVTEAGPSLAATD